MKLHQATQYAIWVTVHLAAQPGQQVSASDLADLFGISQHHLAKVIRSLSFAGLVTSTRGPGGGCQFIADAKRVTLFDIILLFEDNWRSTAPAARRIDSTPTLTEVSRVLDEIDRITIATLSTITLQTMVNNAHRRNGTGALAGVIAQSAPAAKADETAAGRGVDIAAQA